MKYEFKTHDRGTSGGNAFTVIRGLSKRTVKWPDGTYRALCYVVIYDGIPHRRSYVKRADAKLIPPNRGDMDTKVGWETLPDYVVEAMKRGPCAFAD